MILSILHEIKEQTIQSLSDAFKVHLRISFAQEPLKDRIVEVHPHLLIMIRIISSSIADY